MSAYLADGRRRSSMVHATRGHECSLCGRVVFGNGGQVSHGRSHVKRGEAVELLKQYETMSSRLFLAADDERIARFLADGFTLLGAAPVGGSPDQPTEGSDRE